MRAEGGGVDVKVGFMVPYEDLVKPLTFEKAEESHLEDRFDPKTGAKLEPEKVVDVEAGPWVRLNGKEWPLEEWWDSAMEEFFEELGAHVGCGVSTFGGHHYGWVAFDLLGDSCEVPNTSYDCHSDWSAGRALSLSKVVEMTTSFKGQEVRDKLRGMGLEIGEVLIFPALSVQE